RFVFMQPEYLHVLIVPVLTHALPLATLGLLVALVSRSAAAGRLALALIVLSCAAVWPAVHYGEASYDQVKSMLYDKGVDWLNVHRWRAAHYAWMFYLTGGLALVALLGSGRSPRVRFTLSLLTLVVAVGASATAARIAYPGGRVRHKELRHGEKPPAVEAQAARQAYDDDAKPAP
ncbi:MAG: hypothetical protein ACHQ4G_11470, partial [Opitutales bacterium]